MTVLIEKRCKPCEGGETPLDPAHVKKYLQELKCSWEVIDGKKIRRQFTFKGFDEAMFFVNEVAAVAEGEGHHPDMHIFFKNVVIELWTHEIGGLSENDFILASKLETCDN